MSNKDQCFPTFEGVCVSYGGRPSPFLKVEGGDKMDDILERVFDFLESLPTSTSDESSVDLSSIVGITNLCANKIGSTKFEYGISTTKTSGQLTFNFKDTTSTIDNSLTVLKSGVNIITNNLQNVAFSGNMGGSSFPVDAFPLTATFYVDVVGDCGIVQLRKDAVISLEKKSYSTNFSVKDFGGSANAVRGIPEAIKTLSETIKTLDTKLNIEISNLKEENRRLRNLIEK